MEENKFTRKHTQDNYVSEKIDIFTNNLLGDYDNNGNYEIAPQIVNELLELEKYRKSSYGNSMFCVGNLLGYGEIVFEVYFNKDVDGGANAKAYLYVLEDVDKVNGYLQNTIKTLIAEFSSDVGNFIEDSYTKFNIKDSDNDDDEEGKERKDLEDLELDDSYILAKKAYMLLLEKLQEEKMLDAYGKLFTEKLSLISKMDNEFAKAVLERFNSQYALIENAFLKDKNYKALNELMDACIEYVSGTQEQFIEQEQEFNNKLAPALQSFTDNLNDLAEKTEKKALNMLDREDREKLEEMIESQENDIENESISDNDIGGDDAVEIVPTMETIQRMNDESNTEILDNPVLYEGSEEKSKDELEDQSEQEDELQPTIEDAPLAQEAQSIEDIIKNNRIEEPITTQTDNSSQDSNPDTPNVVQDQSQESIETNEPNSTDRPSVIDTSRTRGLEDEEIIPTESPKTDEKSTQETNLEQESKDIEEIIQTTQKEENKIPDSLLDYLNKRNQKNTEVVTEVPKVEDPKVEAPKSDPTPTKTTQETASVETLTPVVPEVSVVKPDTDMFDYVTQQQNKVSEQNDASTSVGYKSPNSTTNSRLDNLFASLQDGDSSPYAKAEIDNKVNNDNLTTSMNDSLTPRETNGSYNVSQNGLSDTPTDTSDSNHQTQTDTPTNNLSGAPPSSLYNQSLEFQNEYTPNS